MNLQEAVVEFFLEYGKPATVKQIAEVLGRSPGYVRKRINDEPGLDFERVEVPVIERNYNTVRAYRLVDAWVPSRHTLRSIIRSKS